MLRVRQLRNRRQGGASLVELALVLFLLVLLLAAVVDFGRAYNSYIVITNASREGAREASRFSNKPERIRVAARREAEGTGVDPDDLVIAIEPDPDNGPAAGPGEPITVIVEYGVPTILTDIVGLGSLPLRARTEMVVFYDGTTE